MELKANLPRARSRVEIDQRVPAMAEGGRRAPAQFGEIKPCTERTKSGTKGLGDFVREKRSSASRLRCKNTTQRRIELGVDLGGAAAWLGLRIALRLGVGEFGEGRGEYIKGEKRAEPGLLARNRARWLRLELVSSSNTR